MVNEAEVKVKSLQKALEILNCFTKKSSWGVTEISEQLDLNKSNVHNILTTFKAMGYLDQDDESGRYKLGLSVYSLCYSLGQNLSIGSVAAPYLPVRNLQIWQASGSILQSRMNRRSSM